MASRTIEIVDVDELSELAEVIQRARAEGAPVVLRLEGIEQAVLTPMSVSNEVVRTDDTRRAAVRAGAGILRDSFDLDDFLRNLEVSRNLPPRPRVVL